MYMNSRPVLHSPGKNITFKSRAGAAAVTCFAIGVASFLLGCGSGAENNTSKSTFRSVSYLLYTDATAGTVNVAPINATGILTNVASASNLVPLRTGPQPIAIAVSRDGKLVYVLDAQAGTVTQVVVATDGSLTRAPVVVSTGFQPLAIAIDSQNRFLVVTNKGSGAGASLVVFNLDPATGELTSTAALMALNVNSPQAVTVSGNFVYVAGGDAIDVLIFNPSDSTFRFGAGSPFPAGPVGANITALYSPPQATNRLYAADTGSNALLSYTADSNGTLTPSTPLNTGVQPVALTADGPNHFLFVANQASNNITVFMVDATTGAVAPVVSQVPIGAGPNTIAYDAAHNLLLLGVSGIRQVFSLAVDPSTGAVAVTGSHLTVENPASSIAVVEP